MHSKPPDWMCKLASVVQRRANMAGFDSDITAESIQQLWKDQKGRCFWFHVPLYMSDNPRDLLMPTLDRIDSNGTYTLDNVVISSLAANLAKTNASLEDWENFLDLLQDALKKEP